MKILTIGDPHFKINNVKTTELMVKEILKISHEINPDIIVVLGDVLDKHETIHVYPFKQASEFIENLSKITKTFVLIGNHDRINNSDFLTELHPFTQLKNKNNIVIVDKVITYENFMFVPYVPPGRFQEAINTVEYNNPKIIFAHQEFKGAKMGAIISKKGDEWDEKNPLVVSGHIHDYGTPQKNIIYTGTPIQHSYGDKTKKTISLFIVSDCITEKRLDLKIPKKISKTITTDEFKDFEAPVGNDLKITIKGFSEDIKSISNHYKIKKWLDMGIKIAFKSIPKKTIIKVQNKKYKDLLYQECKKDNMTLKVFNDIY